MRRRLSLLVALALSACASPSVRPAPPHFFILPLGDSITRGKLECPSYRYFLERRLHAAGRAFSYLGTLEGAGGGGDRTYDEHAHPGFRDRRHEGHGGFRTDQVRAQAPAWLAQHAHAPDLVLILLGTNDVDQGRSPSEAVENLRALVGAIRARAPNAKFLVGLIPPFWGPKQDIDPAARALNQLIRTQLPALDTPNSPLRLVDHNTRFVPEQMGLPDGVHPNAAGDSFIADQWFQALQSLGP